MKLKASVLGLAVASLAALAIVQFRGDGDDETLPSYPRPQPRAPTAHERAVALAQRRYARCMRARGFDYPLPRRMADGAYLHPDPPADATRRPRFERVSDACGKRFIDPVGRVPLTVRERRELRQAVTRDRRVTSCMRRRGYPWPNPIEGEGGWYDDELRSRGIDPERPRVSRDLAECFARDSA